MAITNDILDELIGNAKSQDDLFGKNGVVKGLSKQLRPAAARLRLMFRATAKLNFSRF